MLYIIDDVLEEMALENKTHFSPRYICHRSGILDLKIVTEYLERFIGSKLIINFEVECPEGDSDFAVMSPEQVETEPRRCHICNTEYVPDQNKIWVSFDFTPDFIEHVKKKNAKQLIQRKSYLAIV